jgi:GrpB-like predicted nucleotidyltransferase (UPF0157 family)
MTAMIYKHSLMPFACERDVLAQPWEGLSPCNPLICSMGPDPRDVIEMVDYDREWPRLYQKEQAILAKAFSPFHPHIEHIGSTAVPGLCAKPIIDIMVGLPVLEGADRYVPLVRPLGYVHVEQEDEKGRVFFRKGMPRTHHLHIVAFGGEDWHGHLAFRELLREDPDLRGRYAELKRHSAKMHREDREAYVRSKQGFIQDAVRKAGGNGQ